MTKILSSLTENEPIREYLNRIGAEERSLKTAVVRENHGSYWKDIAVIRFEADGEVAPSEEAYAPTELEAAAIRKALEGYLWPTLKPLPNIRGNLPDELKGVPPGDIFEFRGVDGEIIMLQVRIKRKGEKAYVPWTYWSDDKWRRTEPDGPLPLYNAEKLPDAATVFIHEGAKAARHVQWMVEGKTEDARKALAEHPWGDQLKHAVHLGWIGGALSPYRTDWGAIKRTVVTRAYIVADNDEPGRAAVPAISQKLRIPTYMIQFTNEFPASFDLGDPFPETMFGDADGAGFFTGPSFRDCLHPATWATDLIPNPRGKPTAALRDSFKGQWAYIEEADLFVHKEMPELLRTDAVLNKMLAPFSHVSETSRLILKAYQGRTMRVCFRPDKTATIVTSRGSSAINLHMGTRVKPRKGDPQPFLDFMSYMFVNKSECKEMLRWVATLIARPDVRMGYGTLLVSERQGIGKTTLGAHILAPLVGEWNVSFPSEQDINAQFNEWVANKRLAIISEIYSGASWKSYQTLKAVITDKDITVNRKYMRQFVSDNWCHIFASSNSMQALKMEGHDRRWFCPEITEVPWAPDRFLEFRKWLESGGLSIIYQWAMDYGDYVKPNERAPMTERKQQIIEDSRSDSQKEAVALSEALSALDEPAALGMKDVLEWCRRRVVGRIYDTEDSLSKVMVSTEIECSGRISVHSRKQKVVYNAKLSDILRTTDPADVNDVIRRCIKRCPEVLPDDM